METTLPELSDPERWVLIRSPLYRRMVKGALGKELARDSRTSKKQKAVFKPRGV